MMAYERDLLKALSCTVSGNERDQRPRVGFPAVLDCLSALPFWTTLLDGLGFAVVLSHPAPEDYRWAEQWFAPPSPEVCEPAKESHAHVANLIRQGVDVVVFPMFERTNHCAVSSGYGSVIADGWGTWPTSAGACPGLAVPYFPMAKPGGLVRTEGVVEQMARLEHDVRAVLEGKAEESDDRAGAAIVRWASACGELLDEVEGPENAPELDAIQRERIEAALQRALDRQRQFQAVLERETDETLAWIARDPQRRGLVMAGRPYHVSRGDGASLDEEAAQAGFAVLSLTGLADRGREAERYRRATERVHYFWQSKRLARAAMVAASDPQLDLACLVSFGCGFDAVAVEEVRAIMDNARKPFLVLPMNGSSNAGTSRVRLRTLAAASREREVVPDASANPRPARKDWDLAEPDDICAVAKSLAAAMHRNRGSADAPHSPFDSTCAFSDDQAAPTDFVPLDAERGFCAPDLCELCLTDAVPFLSGVPDEVDVEWVDMSRQFDESVARQIARAYAGQTVSDAACGGGSRDVDAVGVMGNPWLLANQDENHGIFDDIVAAGVRPVPPDFALLRGEDIAYSEQLQRFSDQGVNQILYLMPQGCMKGHVHVRGALHTLAGQFPGMRLTVIDYGPDGAALNRRNRVALALAQAREASTVLHSSATSPGAAHQKGVVSDALALSFSLAAAVWQTSAALLR